MRLLALETSEYVSSLAVLVDGAVAAEQTFESRMNLCETLAGRIAEVLAVADGQVDGLAVSLGPGSFTGLRVGLATAKALAHARHWPLVGVCTQEAIALGADVPAGTVVCVVQNARQGHLHAGLWERTADGVRPRSELRVVETGSLRDFIGPGVSAIVGPGVEAVLPTQGDLPPATRLQTLFPSATAIARLAAPRLAAADPEACFNLRPIYLLASQAERAKQVYVTPDDPAAALTPRRRLILRPARLDDLPDIVRIERGSFRTPWPERALRDEVTRRQNSLFLVAELDGTPAGYVGAWLYAGEAHIHNVAVDPNLRRSGLAEIMMLALIEAAVAAECDMVMLEYRTSNDPAAGLYAKLGFQRVGTRKRYYQDTGEDAIVVSIADLPTAARQAALRDLRRRWEERYDYGLHLAL